MMETYRVQVFLTGIDKERARQVRDALATVVKGAGKVDLKRMMRRAYEGERVLIYQSNDDEDAQAVAARVQSGGATVDIVGLKPPENPF